MMYFRVYYIKPDEGIKEIEAKIKKTEQKKVILVLPQENKVLRNIQSLLSLKKIALGLKKNLSIFTTDPVYQKLAQKAKIPVEESLLGDSFFAQGEIGFRPKVRDIFPKGQRPSPKIPPRRPEPKVERPKVKLKTKEIFKYLFVLVSIGAFGLGGYFSLKFLPKAKIVISPTTHLFEIEGDFLVKKDSPLNLKEKILPAKIIKKEKKIERSFPATGKEFKESKAEGKIIIYNESGSPHFWQPSRFQSTDGKIFWSKTSISIPPGTPQKPGKVEVEVIAEKPGEEYNLGPTDFRVPALKEQGKLTLYNQIYGKSAEPMKGGAKGEVTVVSEDDLKKAEAELKNLKEELILSLKEELINEVPKNLQKLLKEKIVILRDEIIFDKKPKEISNTFKATIFLEGKILSFSEEDLEELIFSLIKPKLKKDVQYEEVKQTDQIKYEISEYNINTEEMKISFKGKQEIVIKIDGEKLKEEIKGISIEEFKKYIVEQMGDKIKNADISLWPFWAKHLPSNPKRIFIEIKYQ